MATQAQPAVRIDAATGRKLFNTRAEKASERIAGKGYDVVDDPDKLALPAIKRGAVFDAEEQARYRQFNEVRKGTDDYMAMEGSFARYLEDHYSAAPVERDALSDECDIVVVGAGFAGLLLWYKLARAGFDDIRFCEKGGDVGGTWYWNRYPGIACDVESYSYFPLLEEMEYYPTMKFASGFEIFEYCQKMAEKFGFYDHCLFHTEVNAVEWDDADERWTIATNRGDAMRARFVMLANGVLTTPRLARIEGMERFAGESFHTARWDYDIDLRGKRIGVIGTGATAVQAIPELAKVAGQLYVFQRTPSTIDVRDQRATTPEQVEEWKHEPGWAKARRTRFAQLIGRRALQANDDFLAGKVEAPGRRRVKEGPRPTREERIQSELQASFRIMEQIRDRIDAIIEDPKTAAALKPYYPYGCKRPTFHDEYLPTFNLPHVTLVDVAPLGVQLINERGVVHDGVQYDLDVLVYATGFDFMSRETLGHVRGVDGRTIAQKWQEEGTRTFLGLHSNGFPNLFIVAGPQGTGGSFNFTDAIEEHTDYVVWLLTTMRDAGHGVVDVREQDEASWSQHCAEADVASAPLRDCLSNFNGYGRAEPGALAYYGGKEAGRRRAWAKETLEPYVFRPARAGR
ncbi:MAG: NAD(P)/FAD-dependent oxidoreductase [Acidimicrobiia bacterium]|nr:NAD(P)/FAD-dependent oxidoreductase [Acidimicrobiia bacterium]